MANINIYKRHNFVICALSSFVRWLSQCFRDVNIYLFDLKIQVKVTAYNIRNVIV